jgi:hypothetical protein
LLSGSQGEPLLHDVFARAPPSLMAPSSHEIVDDYNFVRHPLGHRLSESACERTHEMGVSFLSETEMERCVPLYGVRMPMRCVY